jgi:hypothetical protein
MDSGKVTDLISHVMSQTGITETGADYLVGPNFPNEANVSTPPKTVITKSSQQAAETLINHHCISALWIVIHHHLSPLSSPTYERRTDRLTPGWGLASYKEGFHGQENKPPAEMDGGILVMCEQASPYLWVYL